MTFGGENPSFVEALWRRDRLRFWGLVAPAALVLGLLGAWARGWPLALVAGLLWAPILGFLVAGLWSFAGQRGRGGIGWWVAANVLAVVCVVATLW